jgi:hypothetical protein
MALNSETTPTVAMNSARVTFVTCCSALIDATLARGRDTAAHGRHAALRCRSLLLAAPLLRSRAGPFGNRRQ